MTTAFAREFELTPVIQRDVRRAQQFRAGERGIAPSQLALSGASYMSPPVPPELNRSAL